MSDFDKLIDIARNQSTSDLNFEEKLNDFVAKHTAEYWPSDSTPMTTQSKEELEAEKLREENPIYLAEKERIAMMRLDEESPYQHPCQNEKNTVTLVSTDKQHEIDIEFDRQNKEAMINIIRVEPKMKQSFVQLLHVVQSYLVSEEITKVFQNTIIPDWEMIAQNAGEYFRLTRIVDSNPLFSFAIIEIDTQDVVQGIAKAMAMDTVSHLDKSENAK